MDTGPSERALALVQDVATLEKQLADARAYIGRLEKRLADAGESLPNPPPPPLRVFPDAASIEWEKDAAGRWKHVVIENIGEVKRMGGKLSPDPVLILQHRCIDVTAKILIGLVQPGDDSYEDDPDDWQWLAAHYRGGLRMPLSSWAYWEQFAPYAKVLAEARPDLVVDITSNRFLLTPAG